MRRAQAVSPSEAEGSAPLAGRQMKILRRLRELLRERLSRQSDVTWQLARLETEWLEVSEALEKLE